MNYLYFTTIIYCFILLALDFLKINGLVLDILLLSTLLVALYGIGIEQNKNKKIIALVYVFLTLVFYYTKLSLTLVVLMSTIGIIVSLFSILKYSSQQH